MTPAILLNLLRKGEMKIIKLLLLIFDECHHTTKDHSYNCIMKEFYFHEKVK